MLMAFAFVIAALPLLMLIRFRRYDAAFALP